MFKLTFAILLVVAAQPAVLCKGFDNANPAAAAVLYKLTAGAGLPAASSRRPPRTPGRAPTPNPKDARAERVLPDGAADVPRAEDKRRGVSSRRRPPARVRNSVRFPSGLVLPVIQGGVRRGQEHYDPTGRGGPLLDTSAKYRAEPISENFTVGELSRSGRKYSNKSRIDRRLVICLQSIRDYVDQPVLVRSGYRSYWRNLQVYRDKGKKPTDSQHIAGKASDIKVEGMTGLALAKVAVDACGSNVAVGIGVDFAHVDVRGAFGAWSYEGVPGRQLAELRQYREASRLAAKAQDRRPRRSPLRKQPNGRWQQSAGGAVVFNRPASPGRR